MTTHSSTNITLEKLENLRKSPAYLNDENYRKVVSYTIETYASSENAELDYLELTGVLYLHRSYSASRGVRNAAEACWKILMGRE